MTDIEKKPSGAPGEDEINPHIPKFMADAPWYLNQSGNSLKHQKSSLKHETYDGLNHWYPRGQKASAAPEKFRPGACTNCGAMSHKTKDCCERPRKIGAKFTQDNMMPDEAISEVHLDFEGKRDRWNGYQPIMHNKHNKEYEAVESERRRLKHTQLENALEEGKVDAKGEGEGDEDLQHDILEDANEQVKKERNLVSNADPRTRAVIRNLRIREDTAKYLLNLDLNSAFYDPKTRSMRENPFPEKDPQELLYAGDNWARSSGEANEWSTAQVFAWDASREGEDVHLQAAPSHAEAMYKHYKESKTKLQESQRNEILAKYGGEEHLKNPNKELLFGQSETYREYTRDGKIAKGQEKAIPKSKWDEDVYINNHTTVWGSHYEDGKWGYSCCKQFVKQSFCLAPKEDRKRIAGSLDGEQRKKMRKMELELLKNAPAFE